MISFQRITGRPKLFFGLLEDSAVLGAEAVRALRPLVATPQGTVPDLSAVVDARRKDKEVFLKLDEMLSLIFSTPIEREDLSAIGGQLYRLPKTVEKFAERYEIVFDKVGDLDFSLLLGMLERAAEVVVGMVHRLNEPKGALAFMKSQEARIAQIETEARHVILDAERRMYQNGAPALNAIVAKELYDILGECLDVCAEIGATLAVTVLKNS